MGIPKLEAAHAGSRITFGCSDLTALAQSLVEIGLAKESDWIGAGKTPAALVDFVFRRFLVSAGLKRSQFRRFMGGPHGRAVAPRHTTAQTA